MRFRTIPRRGSDVRGTMVLFSLLCWGPIPLACLWVGSEIDYVSGSVFLGIVVGFLALFPMLFGALVILRDLDGAWILVRRAAGHDQRTGVMGRIFGITAFMCAVAFAFWFLVIHGPGSVITPGRGETPPWPG